MLSEGSKMSLSTELRIVVVVMLYLFPMSAALIPDDFEVFGGSVAFNRPRLQILHPENGEVLETSDLDIIVKVDGYDLPSMLRDSKMCLGLASEGKRIMETCFEQTNDMNFHAKGLTAGANYMLRVVLFDRSHAVAVSVRSFRVGLVSIAVEHVPGTALQSRTQISEGTSAQTTIQTGLQLALAQHEAGDVTAAESIYRQIITQRPDHADALHLLGVALYQNGDAASAIPFIERAILTNTTFENFHNSLGECLRSIGRTREAVSQYELALSLRGDFPEARFNLGMAHQQLRQWDKAVQHYEKVAAYAQGIAVQGLDEELSGSDRDSLSDNSISRYSGKPVPDHIAHEARVRQCDLLQGMGQWESARACLEQGLRQWPSDGHLYNELGNVHLKAGKLEIALDFYSSAVHYGYGIAAMLNMGLVEELVGNFENAFAHHDQALQHARSQQLPDLHILIRRSTVMPRVMPADVQQLREVRRRCEVELDKILLMQAQQVGQSNDNEQIGTSHERERDYSEPLHNAFATGYYLGLHGISSAVIKVGNNDNLDNESITNNQSTMTMTVPQFISPSNRQLKTKLARVFLSFCPSLSSGDFLAEDNIIMKKHITVVPPSDMTNLDKVREIKSLATGRKVKGKIRVGFVSRYFDQAHEAGHLMRGVIRHLNRAHFEVHVFLITSNKNNSPNSEDNTVDSSSSNGRSAEETDDAEDPVTEDIRSAADQFVVLPDVLKLCHDGITSARLHILVYPEIGLDPVIYFLAFGRLAPVQAVFWIHPDTTGIPTIDYFVSTHYELQSHDQNNHGSTVFGNQMTPSNSSSTKKSNNFSSSSRVIDGTAGTSASTSSRGTSHATMALDSISAQEAYSEELFPLVGLGTYFYRPRLEPGAPQPHLTRSALREKLGLPLRRRFHLYICPHPLTKFHPLFDEAMHAILVQDRAGHILIPTTRDKVAWISLLATRFRQNFVRFEKERVRSINSNANTFQDSNFTAHEEHGSIELVAESLVQRVHFLEVVGRDYSARQQEMLSLLQSSEVLLDPFPIGGAMISLQAFSMGTPVVTMMGAQGHAALGGRITYAMYQRLGINDCIAPPNDVQTYVHIALRLAHNAAARQALSSRILALNHKLFEDMKAVREWERFLRTVSH